MNLFIDESILNNFVNQDLKVYFLKSWCEGTKINITWDFDKTDLEKIVIWNKNIYFSSNDKKLLEWWKIFPKDLITNKYLFVSEKIESRCSCSSSFSFEKKLIDSSKIWKLKNIFGKWGHHDHD